MINDILKYITENQEKYFRLIKEHIVVSFIAIMIAITIGIIMAVFVYRFAKVNQWISGFLSIIRMIPSLAILILCIPIIGVGKVPAIIALTLLAIPPIYINTALALQEIPDFLIETALGLGLDRKRIFWKVRLPLALPTILLGIQTSTIEVIASATIASYIGAGGIGSIILTGLNLYRTDLLVLGGFTVAVLAITTDILLSLIEYRITAYQRK